MFLELHLSNNNEKIMVNIYKINSIYQAEESITNIYIDGTIYQVKESYEQIKEAINNLAMMEYVCNRK